MSSSQNHVRNYPKLVLLQTVLKNRLSSQSYAYFSGPWYSLFSCDIDILIAYTVHVCYSVGL